MEVNPQNLEILSHYLAQSFEPNPAHRREAEDYLKSIEGTQGYPLLVMAAIAEPSMAQQNRLAAAILLKNLVKRQWGSEESVLHPEDRQAVKVQIIDMMLAVPESEQKQLSETISIIGKYDFPAQWEDLIPLLVAKFSSLDFHGINGVLRTADPLFHKYRFEERSDALWVEIKYVLDQFAAPLTQLFTTTLQLSEANAGNPDNLKILFDSLALICKLFYSLNFQDLPEYFEDNMAVWMDGFFQLLTMPAIPALDSHDPEKPGLVDEVKAEICNIVALYAQKYDEDFQENLPRFVEAIWNLLTTTDLEVKNDNLVSTALGFLTSVSEREANKHLFASLETLTSICENVIVPNMSFRDSDEIMFEEDVEEYIKRDIEGSDIDTRRRAACDLVRGLCRNWEAQVTDVFSQYVQNLLGQYAQSPADNWKAKDTAIFLVTSLAVKSRTAREGTTRTNDLINVVDFYTSSILPELANPNVDESPVLKADAIKYIMTFRGQIPREYHLSVLPLIINHLTSKYGVVSSYASACIDKLLTMRSEGVLISEAELAPYLESLLSNLFGAFAQPGHSENEYHMKAVTRAIATGKGSLLPYVGIIIERLTQMLMEVAKNPSKPRFNHFLFESIACAIKHTCAADQSAVESFEQALFPPFGLLLTNDVVEFQPYVFQILAQLLETRSAGPIPDPYMELFPHLLMPALWESGANNTPLVRLLRAMLPIGAEQMFPDDTNLMAILGTFQKLNSSKMYDHEGFNLLQGLVEFLPAERIKPYLGSILTLILTRMQSSRTPKFTRSFLVFLCAWVGKQDPSVVVEAFDSIQQGLFAMVLNRILDDVQKVTGDTERKTCGVGMTLLLTKCGAMFTTYQHLWPRLLVSLVSLLELPEEGDEHGEEDMVDPDEAVGGYKASFSKLAFAGHPDRDPFAEIPDVRPFLATKLHEMASENPGQIAPHIPPEVAPNVQGYLHAAGIPSLP